MVTLKGSLNTAMAVVFILFSSLTLNAQDGAELFKKNCASCHTVGKGRMVGPDLKGVTSLRSEQWLNEWIKSSQSMIKSGDSVAVALFHEFNEIPMPDQNLTDTEIAAILGYIKGSDARGASPATASTEPQEPIKSSDSASVADIMLGQHLFEGDIRLTNGGPSCISCHNVSSERIIPGGLLAKDLTVVFSRMGGDAGITGILNAPPFPAMTEAYNGKPITKDEIYALVSFLNTAEKESEVQPVSLTSPLLKYGFFGFALWVVIVLILWRNKKWGMTKQRIFDRQTKTT